MAVRSRSGTLMGCPARAWSGTRFLRLGGAASAMRSSRCVSAAAWVLPACSKSTEERAVAGVINRRDVDFLLDEVFDMAGLLAKPIFADYDRPAVAAVLDLAEQLALDQFLPVAAALDRNEPE